jgi:uncharacterized protein YndB with AHSA1/START domain
MSQVQPQQTRVYETYTRATAENVWQALTDPEVTQQYYYYTRAESDWKQGSTVSWVNQEGNADLEGKILEIEEPRRLVTTFEPAWAPKVEGVTPSTVSYEIQSFGDITKLTLTHAGIDPSDPADAGVHEGWVQIVSSLKSLLETGQPIPMIMG